MVKTELDRRIFDHLKRKLNGKISETTIRPAISRIRSKNPSLTLNVAAEVFAKRYELSVQRFFNDKDREVLKTTRIDVVKAKKIQPKNKLIEIAKYDTDDNLLKRHLEEINKTYTYKCYTSTFIICRKVLENLIIHHIIRKKYSSNSKQDKENFRNTLHHLQDLLRP